MLRCQFWHNVAIYTDRRLLSQNRQSLSYVGFNSIQETKKARSPSPSRTLSRFFRFAKLPGFRRRSRAIKPNVSENVPRNKNRPLSPTKQPARINVPAGVLLNCGEDHEQLILENECLTSALKTYYSRSYRLVNPRPDFFSHLPPVFL